MEEGRPEVVQFDFDVRVLGDLEAIKAAEEGHQWAWNLLVERLAPTVWSQARAGGLGDQEAAEVFRLTWMRAADRLTTFGASSLRTWFEDTAERESVRITGLP
jgi:DNA-directed RNA polymerase specialized sigma24 family protein